MISSYGHRLQLMTSRTWTYWSLTISYHRVSGLWTDFYGMESSKSSVPISQPEEWYVNHTNLTWTEA